MRRRTSREKGDLECVPGVGAAHVREAGLAGGGGGGGLQQVEASVRVHTDALRWRLRVLRGHGRDEERAAASRLRLPCPAKDDIG